MIEILYFDFMRNAILAGIFVSVICGIVGSLVVVNRIVFLAGGIAHAAYGGIAISLFFGIPYLPGTICFSLILAIIMARIVIRSKYRSDAIIGVMWAAGMSVGVILLDLIPGYNVDLMSYLFGSILVIPVIELWVMFALCILVLLSILFFYRELLAISYDEEFARIVGIKVDFCYYLMISFIAISVVMIVRIVGLIMVIALLTISPYVVEKFSNSLKFMMILSSIFNIIFVIVGLWLSFLYNLTSGATIIIVAVIVFALSEIYSKLIL